MDNQSILRLPRQPKKKVPYSVHTTIKPGMPIWAPGCENKSYPKAYILFTILDWQNGVFQLEHEQYAKRDIALLQQRNQLLADLFYEMLDKAAQEDLITREAVQPCMPICRRKVVIPPIIGWSSWEKTNG